MTNSAPDNNGKITALSHNAVFDLIRTSQPVNDLRFSVHLPSGVPGGLSMLENAILVCLLKYSKPQNIFEFGTFLGATTALLAINSQHNAKITTLDMIPEEINVEEKEALDLTYKSDNDNYLRGVYQERGTPYISTAAVDVQDKIQQIFCDSTQLDVTERGYAQQFDFIFIDGGHDLDIIASDTIKALAMAKPDALIIWHDYTSMIHTDVTTYLDSVTDIAPIYHVKHTMLALYPLGKFAALLADLAEQ